jgi:hypothetical protein
VKRQRIESCVPPVLRAAIASLLLLLALAASGCSGDTDPEPSSVYDRRNLGRSYTVGAPQRPADATRELHDLLAAPGVEPVGAPRFIEPAISDTITTDLRRVIAESGDRHGRRADLPFRLGYADASEAGDGQRASRRSRKGSPTLPFRPAVSELTE